MNKMISAAKRVRDNRLDLIELRKKATDKPDRIRIENFWQKPSHFVLGKTVFRRNHLIADLFSKIHFGEKMGTGFERIRKIGKKENAPFPEIEFNENYFYVAFRKSKEYLKIAKKEKPKEIDLSLLNQRQRRALDYLREKGRITNKEYAGINKISRETAKRDLFDLTEKGLLKIIGKGRSLYYILRS
jgi:ATP-dependent DNA helicase RecG